jgi:hypothetical protein
VATTPSTSVPAPHVGARSWPRSLFGSYLARVAAARRLRESVRATIALGMESIVLLKARLFYRGSGTPIYYVDRWEFMAHGAALAPAKGTWCEFGVFRGESLRFLASQTTTTVHGFDAFEGLPEAWAGLGKGTFTTAGKLPDVPPNVRLHVGYFDATVPEFVRSSPPGPLAFVHVDSDLYSSAVTVLGCLAPYLVPGTIVVFDELLGVFHNDEHAALSEELLRRRFEIDWVAFYLCEEWGLAACARIRSVPDRLADAATRVPG